MRLRFLPAAEAELLREVACYGKNARRGTAVRFPAAVEAAGTMAVRHSQGGARSFMDTRAYKVKEFPFLLIYRPPAAETLVVAAAATSRRENYWSSRLD